jgi:hypothetical protein
MGQSKTVNLQQVEFKDKMLEKILVNITKSDCFTQAHIYVLDFFQSSLSIDEYYLSIGKLSFIDEKFNSINYYVIINNIVFLVPKNMPNGLFTVLPAQKKFYLKENIDIGGDYNFLINGTLNGYYKVIYKTCAE